MYVYICNYFDFVVFLSRNGTSYNTLATCCYKISKLNTVIVIYISMIRITNELNSGTVCQCVQAITWIQLKISSLNLVHMLLGILNSFATCVFFYIFATFWRNPISQPNLIRNIVLKFLHYSKKRL